MTTKAPHMFPHVSIKQQPCLDNGSDRRPSVLIWLTLVDLFHRYILGDPYREETDIFPDSDRLNAPLRLHLRLLSAEIQDDVYN